MKGRTRVLPKSQPATVAQLSEQLREVSRTLTREGRGAFQRYFDAFFAKMPGAYKVQVLAQHVFDHDSCYRDIAARVFVVFTFPDGYVARGEVCQGGVEFVAIDKEHDDQVDELFVDELTACYDLIEQLEGELFDLIAYYWLPATIIAERGRPLRQEDVD